jgi:hypothetical protein
MLVFEVAEGLVVKEYSNSKDWIELFDHTARIVMWIDGNRTVIDKLSKPSCEYDWNELKDYLRTLMGARDLCSLGHTLVNKGGDVFAVEPIV